MAMNNFFNKNVINPLKLKQIINDEKLKIIDCRWYINDKKKGEEEFKKGHIPGAIFFDLEKNSDLNNSIPHMLPKKKKFMSFLINNEITPNDDLVIYDQVGFFCSSRVWFTFTYYNFKNVKILNGGIKYWKEKNFVVSNQKNAVVKKKRMQLNEKKIMVVDKEYVKKKINDKKTLIIDARPKNRFLGLEEEPRKNLKKGSIPGSVNIPFTSLVNKNGFFLNKSILKKKFEKKINFSSTKEIICTCGSGITACNIIFGLNLLGVKNLKLYDGSWAQWGKK